MATLRSGLVFLVAASSAGCLELTQEIWVNDDGSGRLLLDISVPEALMAYAADSEEGNPFATEWAQYDRVKAHPEEIPNLRSLDHSEYVEGEFHHFVIEIEVDDATQLPETLAAVQALGAEEEAGSEETADIASPSDMRLEALGDGRMLFVQSLVSESSAAGDAVETDASSEDMEAANQAMMASMFAGKFFTVRLHAPRIMSANGSVDSDAQATEWKIPMADLMSERAPQELRAEFEIGAR